MEKTGNILIKIAILLFIVLIGGLVYWRFFLEENPFKISNGPGSETKESPTATPQSEPIEVNLQTPQDIVKNTPVDSLSIDFLNKINFKCDSVEKTGDLASCILDWQEKNMFYCVKNAAAGNDKDKFSAGYEDCAVDMQFNQMSLGSFPVSKVLELKNRNGKIFGNDYTFATTYCALARSRGLQCRVIEAPAVTETNYGDYGAGYCGTALKSYIDKLGLDCDKWKGIIWNQNALHFWPEVYLSGNWTIEEKPLWAYKGDTLKNITGSQLEECFDNGW